MRKIGKKSVFASMAGVAVIALLLGLAYTEEILAWGGYTCSSQTSWGTELSICKPSDGSGSQGESTTHTASWANTHTCWAEVYCSDGSTLTCSRSDDGKCVATYSATSASVNCGGTQYCS